MSRQSRLSANDKGDNEVKPGAVHRSPGIYLTAEESHSTSRRDGEGWNEGKYGEPIKGKRESPHQLSENLLFMTMLLNKIPRLVLL